MALHSPCVNRGGGGRRGTGRDTDTPQALTRCEGQGAADLARRPSDLWGSPSAMLPLMPGRVLKASDRGEAEAIPPGRLTRGDR